MEVRALLAEALIERRVLGSLDDRRPQRDRSLMKSILPTASTGIIQSQLMPTR